MFISRADVLLEEYANLCRNCLRPYGDLEPYLGKDHLMQGICSANGRASIPQTIDYGIIEKTSLAVLQVEDLGWNDIGSWDSFFEIASADADDIILEGTHIGLDTE